MSLYGRIRAAARRLNPPPEARARYAGHLVADPTAVLDPSFQLDLRNPTPNRTYARIGRDCMVHGRFVFESKEGEVELAPRVFFGGGTVICRSKVSFGTDVFVAWGTYFYDHDSHSLDFRDRRRDILQQLDDHRSGRANIIVTKDWSKVQSRPIRIEADAWIGMDAVILKGVTVGRGAIVGARSVVTKDVPPWTIVAGNPARVVKELAPELRDRTEA